MNQKARLLLTRTTVFTPAGVEDSAAHNYDSLEIFTNERVQQFTSGGYGIQYRVTPPARYDATTPINPDDNILNLTARWLFPSTKFTIMLGNTPVDTIGKDSLESYFEYLDGDIGYEFSRNTSVGHQTSYAWFTVDFGSRKISDFAAVEFDYQATGICSSSRRPSLIVSATPDFSDVAIGGSAGGSSNHFSTKQVTYLWSNSHTFVNESGSTGISSSATGELKLRLTINPEYAKQFDDETGAFTLGFYEHNSAGSDHRISNIKFIEKQ